MWGLHTVGREDFPTREEALAAAADLERRGAKYIVVTDDEAHDIC